MVKRRADGSLTAYEKKIVKRMLSKGWRNQDIQASINSFRVATVNSARITEVKQNTKQTEASDVELEFYLKKKDSYDPITRLNFYDDERLIRAREAMISATQVFNSAGLKFKTELFAVLANISWTYLLHEYYERKGISITGDDGRSLLLSKMIQRRDCPISKGAVNNLKAIKKIRDDVEHLLLGKSDVQWQPIYQACCLNFEKAITELFGKRLSLSEELSFALQFSKIDFDQIGELNKYDLPPHIKSLNAELNANLSEDELKDLDYQFRVVYTFDASTKGRAHIEFVNPESAEGKEISTVLSKQKIADDLYPYKPNAVCGIVSKKTGKSFSSIDHTKAWRHFEVRPNVRAKNPEVTNKEYCIYHVAHNDYTYSENWIKMLCEIAEDPARIQEIRSVRIKSPAPNRSLKKLQIKSATSFEPVAANAHKKTP